MDFRPYEERDLEAMFLLDVACFEPPFRFSVEDIRRFSAGANAVTVVAEDGGELVGFFIVERTGTNAYLVTLDVAPERRGRGIGRELLRRAEMAFPAAVRMVLHVYQGNERAIRFYEASGYVRAGEMKGFYGRGRDAWVYLKELGRREERSGRADVME